MRATILVLVKGLGIGGAEKLLSEGARFWDRDAFDYHVAYWLPHKDQLVPEFAEWDVPVHLLAGPAPRLPLSLRRLIRATGADLVHAHLPTAGVLARVAAPVPVVYTEHNLASSYAIATRTANRVTYSRNAVAIACSEPVHESLASYPGRIVTIANGVACDVDPAAVAAIRPELGIDEATPLVVHVGNIRVGKGHDTLVDAVARLRDGGFEGTVASIGVAHDPAELERLRGRVRTLDLDRHLRFMGRRSDALAFTAACDVYVNPSDFEGLPVAVLEAMCLGKPVVATAVGGVPTVIHDGVTGALVPPGDPAALTDAVEALLADPERARTLGAAAAELVHANLSLGDMVAKVEACYRDILGSLAEGGSQ